MVVSALQAASLTYPDRQTMQLCTMQLKTVKTGNWLPNIIYCIF